ncbi:N-acyl homoserine lactonase family protein [Leeuwenhoekiella sp. MAR_2009_132]|uniref:N-acyl homoserine lactonase family protein n=1 Tax=Leeuwenhoekiella sp. MAR_2009_132 TaxID=1392489 RepID=UPI00048C8883|nr:N-acyl homoserine lactonase family protein [Leeuwenhoekiella sp. MAR_2009_132]
MIKKIAFYSLVALAFASCKDSKKEENKEEVVVEETAKPDVELYAFDGGTVMANNLNLFAQGDTYKGESKELADAFYVIKHPNGILLWDTGLPEMLVGQEPYTPEGGAFTITRKDSILNQLKTINIKPEDVSMIAFSHIHFDHTGAANHFPNAKWLIQQSEDDFLNSDDIKGNTFYAPDSFSALKNKEIIANTDYDVFGDGSVVIKYMPGHTAGHNALFVDLPETGPLVLTGDTYHFEQNRIDGVVPQFNYDIPQSEESIKAFEAFVKEKNAKVIIQHDMDDFKETTKAPDAIK